MVAGLKGGSPGARSGTSSNASADMLMADGAVTLADSDANGRAQCGAESSTSLTTDIRPQDSHIDVMSTETGLPMQRSGTGAHPIHWKCSALQCSHRQQLVLAVDQPSLLASGVLWNARPPCREVVQLCRSGSGKLGPTFFHCPQRGWYGAWTCAVCKSKEPQPQHEGWTGETSRLAFWEEAANRLGI